MNENTINRNPGCDSTTGQCECKSGIVGRECNKCPKGFYNLQSQCSGNF